MEWPNMKNTKIVSFVKEHARCKTRFNLKFHKPKKDVCDLCSSFDSTPEETRSGE